MFTDIGLCTIQLIMQQDYKVNYQEQFMQENTITIFNQMKDLKN